MILEQRVTEKDRVMDREEKERACIYMDWGVFAGLEERNHLAVLICAYAFGDSVLGRETGTWLSFDPSVLGVLVKVVCFFKLTWTLSFTQKVEGMGLDWSVISGLVVWYWFVFVTFV